MFKEFVSAVLWAAIILFISFTLANNLARMDCNKKAEGLQMEHEYAFFGGCRVEKDGVLVPLLNYRIVE